MIRFNFILFKFLMTTSLRSLEQKTVYFHWFQQNTKLSLIQSFSHLYVQCAVKCQLQSVQDYHQLKVANNRTQSNKILLLLAKGTIFVESELHGTILDCIKCCRDLKFQMIYRSVNNSYQLKGIKFSDNAQERRNVVFLIKSSQINVLKQFQQHLLKQKVVQGGFHQNFKAKRRLYQTQYHTLYRAENKIDQKQYALKSFRKESYFSRQDCDGKIKFDNFFDTHVELMKCYHPSFVKFYGVFQTLNSIYIKLQVLGSQFEKYLKQNSFQDNFKKSRGSIQFEFIKKLKIFCRIAEGVAHLHRNNYVHRSLCINSIMIRRNQSSSQKELRHEPVIYDFNHVRKITNKQNSKSQLYFGPEGYAAPQVKSIQIEEISLQSQFKVDVYSLGCILHFMIYQKLPFKEAHSNQRAYVDNNEQNLERQTNKSSQILLNKVTILIKKCLQKNTLLRISSQQLVLQVKSLLQEEGEKITTKQQIELDSSQFKTGNKIQKYLLDQQNENMGCEALLENTKKKVKQQAYNSDLLKNVLK